MQNQHVADDVMSAARRIYLGMPADAADEVRPFAEYVVVEMKTQVVAGTNYFFKVRATALPEVAAAEHGEVEGVSGSQVLLIIQILCLHVFCIFVDVL